MDDWSIQQRWPVFWPNFLFEKKRKECVKIKRNRLSTNHCMKVVHKDNEAFQLITETKENGQHTIKCKSNWLSPLNNA